MLAHLTWATRNVCPFINRSSQFPEPYVYGIDTFEESGFPPFYATPRHANVLLLPTLVPDGASKVINRRVSMNVRPAHSLDVLCSATARAGGRHTPSRFLSREAEAQ